MPPYGFLSDQDGSGHLLFGYDPLVFPDLIPNISQRQGRCGAALPEGEAKGAPRAGATAGRWGVGEKIQGDPVGLALRVTGRRRSIAVCCRRLPVQRYTLFLGLADQIQPNHFSFYQSAAFLRSQR
jgi:hypothetical protein